MRVRSRASISGMSTLSSSWMRTSGPVVPSMVEMHASAQSGPPSMSFAIESNATYSWSPESGSTAMNKVSTSPSSRKWNVGITIPNLNCLSLYAFPWSIWYCRSVVTCSIDSMLPSNAIPDSSTYLVIASSLGASKVNDPVMPSPRYGSLGNSAYSRRLQRMLRLSEAHTFEIQSHSGTACAVCDTNERVHDARSTSMHSGITDWCAAGAILEVYATVRPCRTRLHLFNSP